MTPHDRLDLYIEEGRLIRHAWTREEEGRHHACLLAALAPETGEVESADACPADLMPVWLAHVTVWLDDAGTEEAWSGHVRRYASLARRWHVLDKETWEQVRVDWLTDDVLPEALAHVTVDEWGVREAVEGVRRALRGDGDLDAAAAEADAADAAEWATTAAGESPLRRRVRGVTAPWAP